MASSKATVGPSVAPLANAHICYLREVLGDVQNIIEDAAQKDSYIAKTHKRLSTRLGLNVRSECIFSSLCR